MKVLLIGDVIISPNACLRGDMAAIEVEGGSIQGNCTLHCMPGLPVIVDEWGHIGHGA